jgi:intracellular sulfur oxidation DsrE/DsrF family protein
MERTNLRKFHGIGFTLIVLVLLAAMTMMAQWPAPRSPVIPQADGYVAIPNAALNPQATRTYRAIFDASRAAEKPSQLVPALNMAGATLNDLGATGVPHRNAKLAVVFRGAAVEGLLDEAHFKAKFGVSNPNLPVLAALKKVGCEVFVCGQYLVGERIDPGTLSPDVTVASDALIVLITYQNNGYALMSF